MKWNQGHIDPWWDSSFKNLDFQYYPLKNTHDLVRWINEGYGHLNLNGALYAMPRIMPDFVEKFRSIFPWKNLGFAFYRMCTCDALPLHSDSYVSYRDMFGIDITQMQRAIVFLENWKSGHYFEIDGLPRIPWVAGDWISWTGEVPHYAGNFGLEPRYTFQITGHL